MRQNLATQQYSPLQQRSVEVFVDSHCQGDLHETSTITNNQRESKSLQNHVPLQVAQLALLDSVPY
jgi:hypothetical protein